MKILPKKDDRSTILDNEIKATLKWHAKVDLDLHCFYMLKGASINKPKKSWFKKLLEMVVGSDSNNEILNNNIGHVYYGSRGGIDRPPYIQLDKDSGIGDTGGNNEENLIIRDLSIIKHALIVANIFNKNTNFSKYDGSVIVSGKYESFKVPLTSKTTGSWCVVARIDNDTSNKLPHIINVNKTFRYQPKIEDLI